MSAQGCMSLHRMSGVHLDHESALGCILYRECLSRFLEHGVWEEVWIVHDAVRPGREWKGDHKINYVLKFLDALH